MNSGPAPKEKSVQLGCIIVIKSSTKGRIILLELGPCNKNKTKNQEMTTIAKSPQKVPKHTENVLPILVFASLAST